MTNREIQLIVVDTLVTSLRMYRRHLLTTPEVLAPPAAPSEPAEPGPKRLNNAASRERRERDWIRLQAVLANGPLRFCDIQTATAFTNNTLYKLLKHYAQQLRKHRGKWTLVKATQPPTGESPHAERTDGSAANH